MARQPLSVFSALSRAVIRSQAQSLVPAESRAFGSGWWSTILDWRPGAWQAHTNFPGTTTSTEQLLANWAVYACISLIVGDAGKLCLNLVEFDEDEGVWSKTHSAAFSPVLKKPNHYQTRQKFIEQWVLSRLTYGNTYVLKARDNRGVVVAMFILDPQLVQTLVAENGRVFYRLGMDLLSEISEHDVIVPASEIMHDRAACLFHPLVGVPPLFAAALAASQGLSIQSNSEKFFANMSRPSGVLSSPNTISDVTADRLAKNWEQNYAAGKVGKIAVLGDGLKYEPMNFTPMDSQLVEQLQMTATMVCSAFHVPPFKIGLGALPSGQKVGDMNQIYYSDCLQVILESIESQLDEGLYLDVSARGLGVEFDLDDLLKLDSASLSKVLTDEVKAGILAPNEARRKRNLPPVEGGDSPYLQQQNFSLEALAKRDAQENPFASSSPPPSSPEPAPGDEGAGEDPEDGDGSGAPAPSEPAEPGEDSAAQAAARMREENEAAAAALSAIFIEKLTKGFSA